jgi:hypothetical protein
VEKNLPSFTLDRLDQESSYLVTVLLKVSLEVFRVVVTDESTFPLGSKTRNEAEQARRG